MIDHVLLKVKDMAASRKFFEGALLPIGYRVILAFENTVGE
jgi:hypothetical protein